MRVVQVLVPCSDDFVGPFSSEQEAESWACIHGLKPEEFLAHDMVPQNYLLKGKPGAWHRNPLPHNCGPDAQLVVYRCYDNGEEESCFVVASPAAAKLWLDEAPKPPQGFEQRPGYYFFEKYK